MLAAELSQGSGQGQSVVIASVLLTELHHGDALLQSDGNTIKQVVAGRRDQAQTAVLKATATLSALCGFQAAHLQVVEPVADRRCFACQPRVDTAPEFLEHPQRLLHPGTVRGHHMAGAVPVQLRRMLQAGSAVGGGGTTLFVEVVMAPPQSLAPVLEGHHQVFPLQPEATPVLHDPQSLAGAVEVGIDQPRHTRIRTRRAVHHFRGTL